MQAALGGPWAWEERWARTKTRFGSTLMSSAGKGGLANARQSGLQGHRSAGVKARKRGEGLGRGAQASASPEPFAGCGGSCFIRTTAAGCLTQSLARKACTQREPSAPLPP